MSVYLFLSGITIINIRYTITPEKAVKKVSRAYITLTKVTSVPKYSASPAQTPANILLSERVNFLLSIIPNINSLVRRYKKTTNIKYTLKNF